MKCEECNREIDEDFDVDDERAAICPECREKILADQKRDERLDDPRHEYFR